MVKKAKEEAKNAYRAVLEDSEVDEKIVDYLISLGEEYDVNKGSNKVAEVERDNLTDIKWNIENIDTVDGDEVDAIVVNLTLVYNDKDGDEMQRCLVLTIDEFFEVYKKFKNMKESLQ